MFPVGTRPYADIHNAFSLNEIVIDRVRNSLIDGPELINHGRGESGALPFFVRFFIIWSTFCVGIFPNS
jgi:hypothetical protein